MLDGNLWTLLSLAIGLLAVGTLVFYLIPKMFLEVIQPKDWLTKLRWSILYALLFIAAMSVPSLAYTALRYMGIESDALRNFASVTNRISYFGLIIVLVYIFKYKRRD